MHGPLLSITRKKVEKNYCFSFHCFMQGFIGQLYIVPFDPKSILSAHGDIGVFRNGEGGVLGG